jgi:ADP-heptose:LPS heptosyltransferase
MTETNLLIIHQGALGDVVLTFPAIIALRKGFGRIDILCQGQIGRLAAGLGLVDKVYPLEAAYFSTLFSEQVDPKIEDLLGKYINILAFSFSSDLENAINRTIDRPCLRIPPRPPARERIHVAEYLLQNLVKGRLIEKADANDAPPWRQRSQTTGPDHAIEAPKIIIHPGSGSVRKRWPVDRFLKLADVLAKRRLRPQFVCGPAESDLIGEIQNHNQRVRHFSQLTDLAQWFRTAGGYVGNDSGASHLAAFLGLPCVVIFGPADPKRWKPPGRRVKIVRPALDCHPCFEIEPKNCDKPECLADASLETVVEALDEVYQSGKC